MARTKYFFVSKNQLCLVRQPCEGIFQIFFVFSHFFVRASNGWQYSNFGNKCPKLGTGTPEDIVLTNLGDSLDSDSSGFVLLRKVLPIPIDHSQAACGVYSYRVDFDTNY